MVIINSISPSSYALVGSSSGSVSVVSSGSNGAPGTSDPPSHLVLLFCVSAGKNGEDMGTDEDQIACMVYMLYDVPGNKVVSVQCQHVKPMPTESREMLLSDICREETGLDENAVINGQPLECVLEELDRFLVAKGVHPEKSGRSFMFLTDGQLHLRQCLHHETCSKQMALPSYYNRFYDLRKEFRRRYKNVAHVNDLKGMLDYLGLPGDQSVEYGVRHCQDMASVLHRMITDGHTFGEPQIVYTRLEGGVNKLTDVVDDNVVVRARGLPWQSSEQDIAYFFKGLNVVKAGVAHCLNPNTGRRNGEALIRFESVEHRDLALRRHKHHMGTRYIEVYKASGTDFINTSASNNTEAHKFLSKPFVSIIRMRGLPFTATAQQVLEFFRREPHCCEVLEEEEGIMFVLYSDGRSTGDAFVLFASEEESQKALKKHRENMGTRYIELFKSTAAEVQQSVSQQVLNRSGDPRNPELLQDSGLSTALVAQYPMMPYGLQPHPGMMLRRDCIRVRNLPHNCNVSDILVFLGPYASLICVQGVHMVFTAQGEPSGEAFIQMESESAAFSTVMQKNGTPMYFNQKKRYIEILQVPQDEMAMLSGAGGLPPMPPSLPPMMGALTQGMGHLASLPSLAVTSMGPMPVAPQVPRPMLAAPSIMTAPSQLQLASPQMPSPTPGAAPLGTLGTMPLAQLPQALPTTAFPPQAAVNFAHAQRNPYLPSMIFW